MFRHVIQKYSKLKRLKYFYCTTVTDHQPPKKDLADYENKVLRPFSKDILLNQFNLDLFAFPEIDNNVDLEKVNNLSEKLQNLLQLINETSDDQKKQNIIQQLSYSGIFGLCVPELYQGHNFNNMMLARIMEVISQDMSYLINTFKPRNLACQAMVYAGTEGQKTEYLTQLTTGQIKATVAIHDLTNDYVRFNNINTTAYFDEKEKVYLINGKKTHVKGFYGADYVIVFAKTSERDVSPFFIDVKSKGINVQSCHHQKNYSLDFTTCDLEFENVRVPVSNLMNNCPGNELSRKLATIDNFSVAAACSGLIREFLKKTNDYVCNRSIFGKPLMKYEVMHYYFSLFTDEAYVAESVAFYTAGLLDVYPNNDAFIESCLAKMSSLDALQQSINLCLKIMGTKALSNEDSEFTKIYDNAQMLLFNQVPNIDTKISMSKEAMEYVIVNLKNEKVTVESILMNIGLLKTKCVLQKEYVFESFKYNLHQRVSEYTNHLYKELHQMMLFLKKSSRNQDILNEDLFLLTLSNIWVELFSLVAILSRASRSIAIGLRNHELEVKVAEFHATQAVQKIKNQIVQLKEFSNNIEKDKQIAKVIKEMGGYFVDNDFMK